MTKFCWLDYSEADKQKALDVISLFAERSTVDELGVGTVRDALGDLFFPGTSTIQSRARYFFFIPWIYQRLERNHTPAAEVAQRAHRAEIALLKVLVDSDDNEGTIGIRARENLKRLPSSVYWMGLATLGFRTFHASREHYHRAFDRLHATRERALTTDDGELLSVRAASNWHPSMPPAPPDFPKGVSLRLSRTESEFFRERVVYTAPRSLFAFLVTDGGPDEDATFPWEHQALEQMSAAIQEQLQHARNFSELMHGAALMYNLILAELRQHDEWVAGYRQLLAQWVLETEARGRSYQAWDQERFWEIVLSCGARITPVTRLFISQWLRLAIDSLGTDPSDRLDARRLIDARERYLKRGQARVLGGRPLELWGGESGTARLDYRWGIGSRMVRDIWTGLEGD